MKCSFVGCGREVKARGFCSAHYQQHWAGQTLRPLQCRPKRSSRSCSIAGCERAHSTKGYCKMHWNRIDRHGDPHVKLREGCGRWLKGEHPTSSTIHTRLLRQRGRAAEYACVDCGLPAHEWSYNNADPHELVGIDHGIAVRYSLNLASYDPRCRSCHRRFDSGNARTTRPDHVPAGGDTSPASADSPSVGAPPAGPRI